MAKKITLTILGVLLAAIIITSVTLGLVYRNNGSDASQGTEQGGSADGNGGTGDNTGGNTGDNTGGNTGGNIGGTDGVFAIASTQNFGGEADIVIGTVAIESASFISDNDDRDTFYSSLLKKGYDVPIVNQYRQHKNT